MEKDRIEKLTQEEMDAILYDAREGDLDTIKEIFSEIPASMLMNIKDDITLSTTLHMAAGNGHLELVRFLFSILDTDDAKVLASCLNESGNTALHWASYNGHLDVVKLLCNEFDVDPFVKNKVGHDAVYEAESNNKEDVSEWLLQTFALEDQVNITEDEENTKITYTPGTESKETEKEVANLANPKGIVEDTESLSLNK
ncbi:uncharacterized protein PRCAT00003719001 [Priceomyces carsonii]|uniref:uncharacterized protein n=1 Tax=Priceomyces carsonii TaxID=28549 RepID=UPI002EDB20CA|nr:unnamed protein product [Priceomyces carsonii]